MSCVALCSLQALKTHTTLVVQFPWSLKVLTFPFLFSLNNGISIVVVVIIESLYMYNVQVEMEYHAIEVGRHV